MYPLRLLWGRFKNAIVALLRWPRTALGRALGFVVVYCAASWTVRFYWPFHREFSEEALGAWLSSCIGAAVGVVLVFTLAKMGIVGKGK